MCYVRVCVCVACLFVFVCKVIITEACLTYRHHKQTTVSFYLHTQGRQPDALSSFAEDVYYCSLEYGPEDPRTSLGFYNMGKVGESCFTW